MFLNLKISIEDPPLLFIHLAIRTKHIKTMFGPGIAIEHCCSNYVEYRVLFTHSAFCTFILGKKYHTQVRFT